MVWLSFPAESLFGDYSEWPGRDVLNSAGSGSAACARSTSTARPGARNGCSSTSTATSRASCPWPTPPSSPSTIRVAHSADAIRSAPGIGAEPRIDQTEERRLYDHYGIGYHERRQRAARPRSPQPEPLVPPWRSQEKPATSVAPEPSSWSAVADEEERPNLAPPLPGEPPSPEELEAADIPEPPAVSETPRSAPTARPA